MPAPAVYDLSYRMNIGGLLIPYEYVSNFVAGEPFPFVRQVLNPLLDITAAHFVAKNALGDSTILMSKDVTTVLDSDGVIGEQADQSWLLTLLFTPAETLLFQVKRYFSIEVVFTDETSMTVSQGYIEAGLIQIVNTVPIARIEILNLPGEVEIGQFQLRAAAYDAANNILDGVPFVFFTSDNSIATVNDTGLMNATSPGDVVITVATAQDNLAKRASLTVT